MKQEGTKSIAKLRFPDCGMKIGKQRFPWQTVEEDDHIRGAAKRVEPLHARALGWNMQYKTDIKDNSERMRKMYLHIFLS